jgi:HK97 family phage portal protein
MFNFFKRKSQQAQIDQLSSELASIKNQTTFFNSENCSDFFNISPAGVAVTATTAKLSAAVYACNRLLADSIALMPIGIYERGADGQRKEIDHDLWWMLNESPYPTLSACSYWRWQMDNINMRGDGISQLIRNNRGEIKETMPIPRECVVPKRVGNELIYLINDGISRKGVVQEDILHFPGFGFNGTQGESVISYAARNAVGSAIAADQFSSELFVNGANPSVVISYPQGVAPTAPQQTELREQFNERYTGRGKRHLPMLLVNGGTLAPVSLTPEDSQLLETRKFNVVEICRAFGVPPDFVGENTTSAWGTGLEQRSIAFIRWGVNPHARNIEQELNRKIWPRSLKYFCEFNREGLLAGDSKAESEYFKAALGGPGAQGWLSVNEVRRKKNLPPDPAPESSRVIRSAQQTTPTQKADKNEPDAAAD